MRFKLDNIMTNFTKNQLVKVATSKTEFIGLFIEEKFDKIKVKPKDKDVATWFEKSEVKRFVPKKKEAFKFVDTYVIY